jgi:hypothetical protein
MGFSFDDYADALRVEHANSVGRKNFWPKPQNYDDIVEHSFVIDMINYMHGYDAPVGDLCRMSSYGVVIRDNKEKVVLIDYGLTQDIYNTYYQK